MEDDDHSLAREVWLFMAFHGAALDQSGRLTGNGGLAGRSELLCCTFGAGEAQFPVTGEVTNSEMSLCLCYPILKCTVIIQKNKRQPASQPRHESSVGAQFN